MNAAADKLPVALITPAVRDLAWACFSPPLLQSGALPGVGPTLGNVELPLTDARREWLAALDRAPQRLLSHLAQRSSSRLGLDFERLWHFFLSEDAETDLVAHNLPVREAGQTVGEFDCLYYCHRRERHVHLELAVKFYLQQPGADGGDWSHWIGPNREDRLDRKLNRLLQHQLRLAEQAAAAPALEALGISELDHELEIKGRLFHRDGAERVLPPACPPTAEAPWHGTLAQVTDRLSVKYRYLPLQRAQWLSPRVAAVEDTPLSASELLPRLGQLLQATGRPQQVAALDGQGMERERFFVTPQDWGARE